MATRGKWKKYFPQPEVIPSLLVIGAVGSIVVWKMFPELAAKLSDATPTIKKPNGGAQ